jgi:hypothetical protein
MEITQKLTEGKIIVACNTVNYDNYFANPAAPMFSRKLVASFVTLEEANDYFMVNQLFNSNEPEYYIQEPS